MKTLLLVYSLTCGADAATTHQALSAGARESVLSQSTVANTAIIGAETGVSVFAIARLNQTHPKAARAIVVAAMAFRGYVAIHNAQVAAQMRGIR